jgi:predicted RNase H-like HicB family nuclease
MRRDFTLIIVKEGEWYAGFVKEVPGAITQGKSIEEVQDNIKEALEMVLESNRKHMFYRRSNAHRIYRGIYENSTL